MASKSLTELPLGKKVELLKYLEEGKSQRQAAEKFQVSKGTVSNIKKRKEEYLELYNDENF